MNIGPTVVTRFARLKSVDKFVKWSCKPYQKKDGEMVTNFYRVKKHAPAAIGAWFAAFYVLNTLKSKEIPPERKTPLAINTVINDLFGMTFGYVLNNGIEKFMNAMQPVFEEAIKDKKYKYALEQQKTLLQGFKAIVPLFAFTFSLRFMAPVMATPLADKVNKFLIKHNIIADPQKNQKKTD